MLRLKVAGISSLTDARYCAGMGVEFLSVYFDENGNGSMRAEALAGIRPWIEGVEWIGEYAGNDSDKLRELATEYELETWILRDDIETTSGIRAIKSVSEIPVSDTGSFGFHLDNADFLRKGNPGTPQPMAQNQLIFLSEQVSPEEAVELNRQFPGLIFSLRSSGEDRPGWMDLSDLQDYFEALEELLAG